MIKITKTGNGTDYCNVILEEQIHLFNDDIYDKAIKLMEDIGNLNIAIEEEEEIEINKDEKSTNTKELIQKTIDKHNDNPIKNKEIKTDVIQNNNYDSKNHIISKSNRRHEDIRLYDDFF